MKLELKENMYIRTKDGIIAKVDYIDNDTIFFDKELYRTYGDSIDFLEKDDLERIVKASYSIIDILKKGDYVNGSKVIDISIIGKDKEKWVWVEQMEDNDNKYGDDYVGYNNEQIKSIVTKEQFEQMAYKVGE